MAYKPRDDELPLVALPPVKFYQASGLPHNRTYDLLAAGELDSYCVGHSRLILWPSYLDFVERQRLGIERDPEEKRQAQLAYQRSLEGPGGRTAAQARTGLKPKASKRTSSRRAALTRSPSKRAALQRGTAPLDA
jgi:hypothetical protein